MIYLFDWRREHGFYAENERKNKTTEREDEQWRQPRLQVKSVATGTTFTFVQYIGDGMALFYNENGNFIILDLRDTKVII